jgi:inosine-uridine nucleoside N-ribohydrolase
MKPASILLAALSTPLVLPAGAAGHDRRAFDTSPSAARATRPKVILDNDWSSVAFLPILQALNAGWEVVGVLSDTSDSWALQTGLHALAALELGNLSCIPVYRGADYPILNTPELLQSWEDVHGRLPWQGAFKPQNATEEAAGSNPSSGDPNRIVPEAFIEGYPNTTTFASDMSAAEFLVQQVRKSPGEISIFSGGALTNIALATRLDANFAKNTNGLVIMGGYLDANLLQTTGSNLLADLQSDINLKIDPEAAKMALTADFPDITVVSNAANSVFASQDFLDDVVSVSTPYTELMHRATDLDLPYWDETAAAVLFDPAVVTNRTRFYLDVDTSFASPTYGNIHAYQKALAPRAQKLQEVTFVVGVDGDAVLKQIRESAQYPPDCAAGLY